MKNPVQCKSLKVFGNKFCRREFSIFADFTFLNFSRETSSIVSYFLLDLTRASYRAFLKNHTDCNYCRQSFKSYIFICTGFEASEDIPGLLMTPFCSTYCINIIRIYYIKCAIDSHFSISLSLGLVH